MSAKPSEKNEDIIELTDVVEEGDALEEEFTQSSEDLNGEDAGLDEELDELFSDFENEKPVEEEAQDQSVEAEVSMKLDELFRDDDELEESKAEAEEETPDLGLDLEEEIGAETDEMDFGAVFGESEEETLDDIEESLAQEPLDEAGASEVEEEEVPEFVGDIEEIEEVEELEEEISIEEAEPAEGTAEESEELSLVEEEESMDFDVEIPEEETETTEEDLADLDSMISDIEQGLGEEVAGAASEKEDEELDFDVEQEFSLDEEPAEADLPDELQEAGFEAEAAEVTVPEEEVREERVSSKAMDELSLRVHQEIEDFSRVLEEKEQGLLKSLEAARDDVTSVRNDLEEFKASFGDMESLKQSIKQEITKDLESMIAAGAAKVIREEIQALMQSMSEEE